MLTTGIFLTVFLGTLTIILGLFISLFLVPLKNDIRDIRDSVQPLKQIDEEARRLGLHEYLRALLKTEEHHSLPSEKAQRKEELLDKGRTHGLDTNEADELKRLLNEETWNDFASGLIGVVAAIGLIALIGAFISSLTRRG